MDAQILIFFAYYDISNLILQLWLKGVLGDWRRSLCGGFSFRLMCDVLKDNSGGFLCTVGHLEEEGFLVVSLKNAFFFSDDNAFLVRKMFFWSKW